MTKVEEIMNSGEIYKVADATDPHYYEYLQMMETYNSLGYTDEGEKGKTPDFKGTVCRSRRKTATFRRRITPCGAGTMFILENNVYINFNCTFVDDAQIYIGDHTMIEPNATIIAVSHRYRRLFAKKDMAVIKPVHIGKMSGSLPM